MPTVFSHAVVSYSLGYLCFKKSTAKFLVLTAFCSIAPDIDVLGFSLGIPYDSPWGHRGFTHSLFFAAFLAIAVTTIFFRDENRGKRSRLILAAFFFLATASHGLLDAMTNARYGVAFFSPFDHARYSMSWRMIPGAPIGRRFFSWKGLDVLSTEIMVLWVPSFAAVALAALGRRRLPKALPRPTVRERFEKLP